MRKVLSIVLHPIRAVKAVFAEIKKNWFAVSLITVAAVFITNIQSGNYEFFVAVGVIAALVIVFKLIKKGKGE